MPPLRRQASVDCEILVSRNVSVLAEAEVLVVGGGPAGIGAAIGAADAGADVILAEAHGFFGGTATAGQVNTMMSYHTSGPVKTDGFTQSVILFPRDHGEGVPVISGILGRFVERLIKSGGALPPSAETGYVVPFDPEICKQVAFDMVEEVSVRFLLHAFASGHEKHGEVSGVVFETKSGPIMIRANTIVDCTGDGDVAALAGAPFEVGRESDQLTQPMTLMFRIVGFDKPSFDAYVKEHPDQWSGVSGLGDLIRQATEKGELQLRREDILFFGTPHDGEVSVNSTRVTEVLGTDVLDLTYAEWEGRRQVVQVAAFLKKWVPGFRNSYVVQTGTSVGVRESRRFLGEYSLTAEDINRAGRFGDVIARGSYPMDIHNPKGRGTWIFRLPVGQSYDIPLRCLIPKKVDDVVLAGRCISGGHEALASYRTIPISMATGQAAGVCAAIASRRRVAVRQVKATDVQDELVRQGAILDVGAGPHV